MTAVDRGLTVEDLARQVADLATSVAELRDRAATNPAGGGNPQPLYDDAGSWVREWLLVNYNRPFGVPGQRWCWCERWWQHNEAVIRLTALWFGWEHSRLEQTGMLTWLREADYQLQMLCGPDGPFRECSVTTIDTDARHRGDEFAPVTIPPAGWFDWWDAGQ